MVKWYNESLPRISRGSDSLWPHKSERKRPELLQVVSLFASLLYYVHMEVKIQQIVAIESKICGLGDDNKMYRWDYGKATWVPNWNPNPETIETK